MAVVAPYPFEWFGKSRASLPKVKTGCSTCKKRHVKCDEGKPNCKKCQKSNRTCVYQVQQMTVSKDAALKIHIRYPSPQSPPARKFFSCEAERCGFDSFQQIPPEVLGDGLGWQDLGRTILQNSENDTTLRHAVIAVGAIHGEALRRLSASSTTARSQPQLLPLAFKHYQQSIQSLRNSLKLNLAESIEANMLTCVLLVVFDFVRGDDHAAIVHLSGGIAMLRQYLTRAKLSDPLINQISAPWRMSLDRSGVLPKDGSFGARLLLSYGYIDFWLHCWMDDPPALPEVSVLEGLAVERKPQPDNELHIAFQRFSALENRIREFQRAIRGRKKQPHVSGANFATMKAELTQLLDVWNADYAHIRSTVLFSDQWDVRAANVVALNYKKTRVMLLASQEDGSVDYQAFTPVFEEVLCLSQQVLDSEEFPTSSPYYSNSPFAFISSIVHPLYITAINCSDLSVCQRAIDMLSSRYWREGAWNSFVTANMAKRKFLERQRVAL